MQTTTGGKDIKPPKPLPPPNSDFYQLAETLPPDELATLRQEKVSCLVSIRKYRHRFVVLEEHLLKIFH